MSLAAERTYLAYVRTALALLAGGVAVVGALPEAEYPGLRRAIGSLLVLLGLLVAGGARARWRQVDSAMRRGEPLPRTRVGTTVSTGVFVAGLLALAFVVLT
jgi:putative membrane protein